MSDVTEEVVEVIDEAADVAAKARGVAVDAVYEVGYQVGRRPGTLVAIGFASGAIIGGGLSFFVTKKRLSTKFDTIAKKEIAQMRGHYFAKMEAAEEQAKPSLSTFVKDLGYATKDAPDVTAVPGSEGKIRIVDTQGSLAEESKVEVAVEQVNVFTDEWDYDKELASRTPDQPYIIHRQEFEESERESTTLTYYLQDDVLADEADKRMEDIDGIVGLENLEKFGHGSDDANMLYVRNDGLEIDFEILRSAGSFTAEVLGIDDEADSLQHSGMRRRAPRFDDD